MITCDGCGVGAEHFKFVWRFQWHNGIVEMIRHYCPTCVKKEISPPKWQIKQIGSVTKVVSE